MSFKYGVIFYLISMAFVVVGCGGGGGGGSGASSSESSISLVFSDNFDRCGNAIVQSAVVTIIGEDGSESVRVIDHSGVERAHNFPQETDDVRKVHIEKPGADYHIYGVELDNPIYIRFTPHERQESCGCNEYSIHASGELYDEYGSSLRTIISSRRSPYGGIHLIDSPQPGIFIDEICEVENNSVFAYVYAEIPAYVNVPLNSLSPNVSSLTSLEPIDIDLPEISRFSQSFLAETDGLGDIEGVFYASRYYADTSDFPPRIFYDNHDAVTDIRYDFEFLASTINIENTGSYFSSEEIKELKREYILRVPNSEVEQIGANILNPLMMGDVNISVTDSEIIIDSEIAEFFNLAVLTTFFNAQYPQRVESFLPIENGRVDLTEFQSMYEIYEFSLSEYIVRLYSIEGATNYNEALSLYNEKLIEGGSFEANSIYARW